MATITVTPIKTFVSGETVTPTKLNELGQSTVVLTAGTIVDADVSASAAIALSKLATGALPTAITTATANYTDASVTAPKLAPKVTFPDYGAGSARNYNQTYQAAEDGYLLIVAGGSFRNYAQMVVGTTNSPATVVWQNGDDINVNTKYASGLIPVPKDIYYKVQGGDVAEGFESVVLTWFPVSS